MSGVGISFIIPVRDDAVRLARCLASIRANLTPDTPAELIVADNGSTDDSVNVARTAGARVLSIPNEPVAIVRNRAASAASHEVLAFIDADHTLAPGWVAAAQEVMAQPDVVAAGFAYDAPRDGAWVQRLYDAFRDHAPGQSDAGWLASGNLLVRREIFLGLGGFDEALETCEDVDLCKRLRRTGQRVLSDSRLASTHHGDPRTLNALFWGELWRGRDNLRVSLRPPVSARDLPSLVIPIVYLFLLTLATISLVGLLFAPGLALLSLLAALLGLGVLSALRTSRMLRRLTPLRQGDTLNAFRVAATYDAARALALVVRIGHKARRQSDARSR